MKVDVIIYLKDDILDPQGKAVQHALNGMGFEVSDVRVGKTISFDHPETDATIVEGQVSEMADKLLANPVIEQYQIKIDSP